MKTAKKLVALFVSVLMLAGVISVSAEIPTLTETNGLYSFYDDFSQYTELNDKGEVDPTVNWVYNEKGTKYSSGEDFHYPPVVESGYHRGLDTTWLKISNNCNDAYISSSDYGDLPLATWSGSISSNLVQEIGVIMATNNDHAHLAGGGVRFMVHNSGKNYYELYLPSSSNSSSSYSTTACVLFRCVNGTREEVKKIGSDNIQQDIRREISIRYVKETGEITFDINTPGATDANGNSAAQLANSKKEDLLTTVIDNSFAKYDGDTQISLFASCSVNFSNGTYYTNFSVKGCDPWMTDKAFGSAVYKNLTYGRTANENSVTDLGAQTKIRNVSITGATSDITVGASVDGENYDILFTGTPETADFVIENSEKTLYKYIKIEGDFAEAKVYDSLMGTIELPLMGKGSLAGYFGKLIPSESVTWKSLDQGVFTVSNGEITAKGKGEATLTAEYDGKLQRVKVKVVPELEYYKTNNIENEYIAAKRIVTDKVNEAIKTQNADLMKDVIFTINKEYSLSKISDIDLAAIMGLVPEKQENLATALLDYDVLYEDDEEITVDDIFAFVNIINAELKVYELDNLATKEEVKFVIDTNKDIYGIDTKEDSYVKYEMDICDSLTNTTFVSIADLQRKVAAKIQEYREVYLMEKIAKIFDYASVCGIVEECDYIINYDKEKYDAIEDKQQFEKDFFLAKDDFKTAADVKNYIDTYTPPEKDEEEEDDDDGYYGGGGGGGSSGGGGGGFAVSIPPVVTTKPVTDGTVVAKTQVFPDIPVNHWAYEGTRYLSAINAAKGYEDGTFGVNNKITRAEFVKILLGGFEIASEEITEETEMTFGDVVANDWFAKYFETAYAEGIVLGDENGNANPNAYITREEIAVMISRLVEKQGKILPKNVAYEAFDDEDAVSSWAYTAVAKMKMAEIINGDGTGNFLPKNNATRGECAKMIYTTVQSAYVPQETEVSADE